MTFTLPDLPYAHDALEPTVDARTMEIHHGKHHAGYVAKLNAAIESHADLASLAPGELCASLSRVPEAIRGAVRNNGGGHFNHSLFWTVMKPGGSADPAGDLGNAIKKGFGSLDALKTEFSDAAATRFGSGWAWLGVASDGELCVTSTPNQDNPLMTSLVDKPCVPILGLDVWEHAYYLHYQNRRPDYIKAWWDVVDWSAVERRFDEAKSHSMAV